MNITKNNQERENMITGDRDKKVYTIKSEEDFNDFLKKYKDEVFCDLKSVEDWQLVEKNNEDSNGFWREEHNKQFPSGTFIMINTYENKKDVIEYLEDKITNIETFYLS